MPSIDMDGNDGLTGNEVKCAHCWERVPEEEGVQVPGEGLLCLECAAVPEEVDADETTPLPVEPMASVIEGRLR